LAGNVTFGNAVEKGMESSLVCRFVRAFVFEIRKTVVTFYVLCRFVSFKSCFL